MRSLKDSIVESVSIKPTFKISSDVYNVLSDLAFEYDKKNKDFDKDEVKKALDSFMDRFFEEMDDDED
jgi:hypothetical protein